MRAARGGEQKHTRTHGPPRCRRLQYHLPFSSCISDEETINYQRCGSYDTRYLLVLVGLINLKLFVNIVLLFAKQIM